MKMHNATFLAALMCVAHQARAQSQPKIPVAARDLARGATLGTADIRWADTTLTDGSEPSAAPVTVGWVAKRTIHAGEILREPGVARPTLVSSGAQVDVMYSIPGVSIKVRGTAAGNGSEGDEVYVKLDNRKRLRGIVAGPNTVRVM